MLNVQQSSKLQMMFLSRDCSQYYRVAGRGRLFQTNGACLFDLDVRPYDSLPWCCIGFTGTAVTDTNALPHLLHVSLGGVAAPYLNMLFKDMNIALTAEGIDLPKRSLKVDSLIYLGHKLRR